MKRREFLRTGGGFLGALALPLAGGAAMAQIAGRNKKTLTPEQREIAQLRQQNAELQAELSLQSSEARLWQSYAAASADAVQTAIKKRLRWPEDRKVLSAYQDLLDAQLVALQQQFQSAGGAARLAAAHTTTRRSNA